MTSTRTTDRVLISADSHVIEPTEIWADLLPEDYWGDAPKTFADRPGGTISSLRLGEMETDGVSAEVLYPSLALKLYDLDADRQGACFGRYNDWLADYCSVCRDRLLGIGQISVYDIDVAVAEARRCAELGFPGVQIWQSPHPDLPFDSQHYEPLWSVCAELGLSVSLHILTGFGYPQTVYSHGALLPASGGFAYKVVVNEKLLAAQSALVDIIFSGALDRHRDLRLILVENEVGWLPFFVDQLDYYAARFEGKGPRELERRPSQVMHDQVLATFFRDPNAAFVASRFDNVMWSSDYPHGNSTWPHSQEIVAERLAGLDDDHVDRIVRATAVEVFHIPSLAYEGADR